MAKSSTVVVLLKSTASHYAYTIKKNSRLAKLKIVKYDPVVRKHVIFEEKKAPNPKAS